MRGKLVCLIAVLTGGCGATGVNDDPGSPVPDAGSQPDAFVFPDAAVLPALRVDYADPDHGPFVGGTEVTLRGRGFAKGMIVTIGGKLVEEADLELIDGQRAVIKTPAGVPGQAELRVTAGAHETVRENAFLYEPIYLEPAFGSTTGGTYVRLRGIGTAFAETDLVTLDGKPLQNVSIVNGQELVGYTPDGIAGFADLRVLTADGELVAEGGFRYEASVTQFMGGMGGGPIDGSVSVNVIDAFTGDGVPLASVVLGDPATSPYQGVADLFGQITFSAPDLRGPVVLSAGHKKYETGMMVGFDARDVSIFIQPLPLPPEQIPPSGPFGPGREPGTVSGDVVFGGATGLGTTQWDLVPEPRTETEIKRTYVFTTQRDIFSGAVDPGPGGTIDYQSGQESWQYNIPVRSSAFALVAIAGLFDPRTNAFTPYAMGVLRNVLVGPDEDRVDLSINIDIPLDSGMKVVLADVPGVVPEGPDEYRINALIDLGGEGVIRLPGGRAVFNGQKSAIMTGLAPIGGAISDASYTIVAGSYTARKSSPYSVRILRGVRDLGKPVTIDGFVGVPRFTSPAPGGGSTDHRLVITPYGGGVAPTFYDHRLRRLDNGHPVWRVISRGNVTDVPLYDLSLLGLPPPTTHEDLFWTTYGVTVQGGNFDTFNYGHTNANTWSAYSYDSATVAFE